MTRKRWTFEEKRVLLFFPLIFSLMLTRDCPVWKNLFHFFISGPLLHKRSQLHRFLLRPGGIDAGPLYQLMAILCFYWATSRKSRLLAFNHEGAGLYKLRLGRSSRLPKSGRLVRLHWLEKENGKMKDLPAGLVEFFKDVQICLIWKKREVQHAL